jgi:hypothetical protein
MSSSKSSSSSSRSSSSNSSATSSSSSQTSLSVSSSSSANAEAFIAITNQYEFEGINPTNALYRDSNRFRIYYGGTGMMGPANTLGTQTDRNLNMALDYLEAAYDMFVSEWGYRSTGLSVHSDTGPHYKMNIYSTVDLDAGGVMLYDNRAGLSYLEVQNPYLANADIVVHEFGHALTLTEYHWVNQGRTGAWWETVAQWVADTFKRSTYYAAVGAKYGVSQSGTIIDLNTTLGRSYLTLVHADNRYQAWPFLTYLTNNPDNFAGLNRDSVVNLMRNHQNNETPLHTLNRMVSPLNAQTVIGYYWAHMAYLDIGHSIAQQRLFSVMNGASFRTQAYANLDSMGNQIYKVKTARQPMYAGANIIPLTVTGSGSVEIQVTNLGNGLADSNFTAIVAIRSGNSFRYQLLENGNGNINIASSEEASLVVANTPDNLIQYDAFASKAGDADVTGLNYQVKLTGAVPRD